MEDLKNKWLWIVIAAVVVILIVAYATGWIGG